MSRVYLLIWLQGCASPKYWDRASSIFPACKTDHSNEKTITGVWHSTLAIKIRQSCTKPLVWCPGQKMTQMGVNDTKRQDEMTVHQHLKSDHQLLFISGFCSIHEFFVVVSWQSVHPFWTYGQIKTWPRKSQGYPASIVTLAQRRHWSASSRSAADVAPTLVFRRLRCYGMLAFCRSATVGVS